jgi:hypothetical protein
MPIVFVCRNGSLAGKRLEYTDSVVTLGRAPTNMVRFSKEREPGVSNLHCEVFELNGSYYVRDMGSANGTFLNGTQVKDPVMLQDGAVLELGNPGPELVVSFPSQEAMTMVITPGQKMPSPPPPASPGDAAPTVPQPSVSDPIPQHKDGIGMPTLMAKLDMAKNEVRGEYKSRMRLVYVAGGVLVLVAIAVAAWFKISGDRQRRAIQTANERRMQELQAANERKLQEMQSKFDRSKQDAEKRYEEIKANAEASAQSKLADLQKLLDEETASIKKLTDEAKKAGMDSATVNAEMRRNREALAAIQAQIGDLTAFVNFKERYSKCVYSLVLRFTENGKVKYSFVGSAFSFTKDAPLLGTSARVVAAVKPLLEDGTFHLIARCNGDADHSYLVAEAFVHPEFKQSKSGVGKDVALLRLDLRALKADGTYGDQRPLPDALEPASGEELDKVVSGVNVAVFGFSDLDRVKLEGAQPVTGVATLATNIVDGTFSFDGQPVKGRSYGMLRHNCAVMKGFAGAPVVNTKNHVVGVQSNTTTLAAARGGLAIPAPNSACAVNVATLQDLQKQFLQRTAGKTE